MKTYVTLRAVKMDEMTMAASRRADPGFSQVSGYVPKDLALKFKVACTAKEMSQSEALEKAIALWLAAESSSN
ncbi:MAG TPA: hypothetical protein V6D29_24635 [Leptolyngbyaceae cyanobacterium]